MPATDKLLSSAGNMVGAVIADASTPRIVLFSNDGTPQNSVAYSVNYGSTLTGRHLIVDLTPGTYDIYQNGTKIFSNVPASSQGVLTFQARGGANYSLVQTGTTVVPTCDVNGDGVFNIADVAITLGIAVGLWFL